MPIISVRENENNRWKRNSALVPDNYSCKNIFSFVFQIKNANLSRQFFVSYDVTSLFTNIPLQETIDIAINLIFNHNSKLNISKKELKKLFLFATSQSHFLFNGKFYNQIDGVDMDCSLAPVLTNIFIGFYESKWLNEYILKKPTFYWKYVDEILATFEKKQHSLNFLDFLNNKHPNIKQVNHFIAFLDVFISGIDNQNFTLQKYHKSIYTEGLLNCNSFTWLSNKISLIKCRSFKICSSWNPFHIDIENINSNLNKNAYPPFLIDTVIKKYLDHKFSINQNQLKDTSYHILATFCTILKIKIRNFAKNFVKRISTLS